MKLYGFYPGADLYRRPKALHIRFTCPHRVISTDSRNGGLQTGVTDMLNCRVSEPDSHEGYYADYPDLSSLSDFFSEEYETDRERTVFLFTAANMKNGVWKIGTHEDLTVAVVCTAGASGNAVRAGDPASYRELNGVFRPAGTINLCILINKPVTPGGMVRACMTATEAKTAALQELQIASGYSAGLATGTGTDQIAVASLQSDETPLSDAGTHSKLGELIGRVCIETVKSALELQDGIDTGQRGLSEILLQRLGVSPLEFRDETIKYLQKDQAFPAEQNFRSIQLDCAVTAAFSGLLHTYDLCRWGTVTPFCFKELLHQGGLGLALAVAGDAERAGEFRGEISVFAEDLFPDHISDPSVPGTADVFHFCCRCFALGFSRKWDISR